MNDFQSGVSQSFSVLRQEADFSDVRFDVFPVVVSPPLGLIIIVVALQHKAAI